MTLQRPWKIPSFHNSEEILKQLFFHLKSKCYSIQNLKLPSGPIQSVHLAFEKWDNLTTETSNCFPHETVTRGKLKAVLQILPTNEFSLQIKIKSFQTQLLLFLNTLLGINKDCLLSFVIWRVKRSQPWYIFLDFGSFQILQMTVNCIYV